MTTSTGRDLAALTETARQRQDRRLLIVVPVLIFGPLLLILAVLSVSEPRAQLSAGRWLLVLGYLALGPLLGIGLVTLARRRGATWIQPSPFAGLDRPSRRQLLRAMRRGEPIHPDDREVVAELADRIRRARWTPFLCSAPLLLQVVNVHRGGFFGTFACLAVLAGIGFASWSFYVHHRISSRLDL